MSASIATSSEDQPAFFSSGEAASVPDAVLASALRCIDEISAASSSIIGMEGEAGSILLIVDAEPCTVTTASKRAGLTHSATVRVLEKLHRAGLVTKRRCDEDNREVISTATVKGERAAEKIRKARDKAVQKLIDSLRIEECVFAKLPPADSTAWRML